MKVGAQDSGVTLKEVFSGRLSPELKLTLEIGKIHLTLPRNKDFWTLQDSDEVVWNKKPISLAGRNGRYVRYRLMFGPFILTESKLMEPLVYRGGKGHPTGQGWRLNVPHFHVFPSKQAGRRQTNKPVYQLSDVHPAKESPDGLRRTVTLADNVVAFKNRPCLPARHRHPDMFMPLEPSHLIP